MNVPVPPIWGRTQRPPRITPRSGDVVVLPRVPLPPLLATSEPLESNNCANALARSAAGKRCIRLRSSDLARSRGLMIIFLSPEALVVSPIVVLLSGPRGHRLVHLAALLNVASFQF